MFLNPIFVLRCVLAVVFDLIHFTARKQMGVFSKCQTIVLKEPLPQSWFWRTGKIFYKAVDTAVLMIVVMYLEPTCGTAPSPEL